MVISLNMLINSPEFNRSKLFELAVQSSIIKEQDWTDEITKVLSMDDNFLIPDELKDPILDKLTSELNL